MKHLYSVLTSAHRYVVACQASNCLFSQFPWYLRVMQFGSLHGPCGTLQTSVAAHLVVGATRVNWLLQCQPVRGS